MRFAGLALLVACCGFCAAAMGDGEAANCAAFPTASPVTTETASAGVLSNLTNRAGSIRAASNSMLTSAIETARADGSGGQIVFRSIPQLSTKADADDQMCKRLENETTKDPLEFDDKRFASVDELTDWIMDFTQGKGADGKSLYTQCPGACSPQYTWRIDPDANGLNVKARVVCGPPRDRDSDKYQLSVEIAPPCPAATPK